jgi:prepilin-type N-terminal cleavage/methylation domain-containing protein/prepilin-type processing-associated H-X9-DG protein
MFRNKRVLRGFTLIELLVVIAIMAILAGILFPVLASARESARCTRCISNLRQLSMALQMYASDNDGAIPNWWQYTGRGYQIWPQYLSTYYKSDQLIDEKQSKDDPDWLADYVYCTWGPGGHGTASDPYWKWPGPINGNPSNPPMQMDQVRRPSETIAFTDGSTGKSMTRIIMRHRGGTILNCALMDGHAAAFYPGKWDKIDEDPNQPGFFYYKYAAADR